VSFLHLSADAFIGDCVYFCAVSCVSIC